MDSAAAKGRHCVVADIDRKHVVKLHRDLRQFQAKYRYTVNGTKVQRF